MMRESCLEREPPIVLLIDASTLAKTTNETPSKSLLAAVASLMANTELARTHVGLVLYDEHSIIASIQTGPGMENREQILRTLVKETERATKNTSAPTLWTCTSHLLSKFGLPTIPCVIAWNS